MVSDTWISAITAVVRKLEDVFSEVDVEISLAGVEQDANTAIADAMKIAFFIRKIIKIT